MAHFSYIHGATAAYWPIGTVVTPQNFADFDSGRFKSINGDEGGTWAPSSVITIGGSGLSITGDLVTYGDTTIGNATTGLCLVKQTTQFDCDVIVGIGGANSLTVNSPTSNFNGNVTLGNSAADTLNVNAATSFENNVTVGSSAADTLTVNSTSEFKNDVTVGSDSTDIITIKSTSFLNGASYLGVTPGTTGSAVRMDGDLTSIVGGGRIALSTIIVPDTDAAYNYAHNYIYNVVTDNRNLTLTIPNPRIGTEFWVHIIGTDGSGNVALIINGVTYGTTIGSSTQLNAKVVYTGAVWHIVTF